MDKDCEQRLLELEIEITYLEKEADELKQEIMRLRAEQETKD